MKALALVVVLVACGGGRTAAPTTVSNAVSPLSEPTMKVLAELKAPVTIHAYLSSKTHPKLVPRIAELKELLARFERAGNGKVRLAYADPVGDERLEVARRFGVKPMALPFSTETEATVIEAYFSLVVDDERSAGLYVQLPEIIEQHAGDVKLHGALEQTLARKIRRLSHPPPAIGLWTPPGQRFALLREGLAEDANVRAIERFAELDELAGLVIAGPADLAPADAAAIERFAERGGGVVVLAGRHRFARMDAGKISVEKVTTGLDATLARWGVRLGEEMVLDPKSLKVPMPTTTTVDGQTIESVQSAPLVHFVKVERDAMAPGPLTAGAPVVVMSWATPVEAKGVTLLRSSPQAWTSGSLAAHPDLAAYPDFGFPAGATRESFPLAVALADHRVVVFGSSSFASDLVLQLGEGLDASFAPNVTLVRNAVIWAVER